MSRVFVNGLSKSITEEELKEIFSQKGEVTDVRVMRTKTKMSRGFGFVGFRSPAEAQAAISYFNHTYLKTCKISVELASPKNMNDKEDVLEKKASVKVGGKLKSTMGKDKVDVNKKVSIKPSKEFIDKEFTEFMTVMKSRRQAKLSSNEDGNGRPHIQSDDLIGSLSTDEHVNVKEQSELEVVEPEESKTIGTNDLGSHPRTSSAVHHLSDMEFLRSKVKKDLSEVIVDTDISTEGDHIKRKDQKSILPSSSKCPVSSTSFEVSASIDEITSNEVDETGRLFVRNLQYAVTEDELREHFSSYGPISEVHVPLDGDSKGKGFAFVHFLFPEDSHRAIKGLDGTSFQGRLLHIIPAQSPREVNHDGKSKDRHLSSYQQKKEEERKKNVSRKEGWNSSFVRSDAVVESLAERYGVKASDIINTNEAAGDIAVSLALGESQIIQENREYLASHGVNIEVLESNYSSQKASSRSTTTMLVKNLPHDFIVEELENMFAKHGMISSFLVPKSKTIAVVDFVEPSEARAAFKALAYRSYHKQPLYIEWAATDLLNRSQAAESYQSIKRLQPSTPVLPAIPSAPVTEDLQEYSTLYVKNLSFATTEESFYQYLLNIGLQGIRTISIQRKPDSTISMGYGFIEFTSTRSAENAIKKLQQVVLDGHALEVKPSNKRLSKAPTTTISSSQASRNSKLVVKNVPFQATQSEIRSLFATYGSVKSVRIPKKQAGVHRGFAFIDFVSHQEALAALQALSGTHFYGRHLVIDWTKEEDDEINVLRKRAQHHANVIEQSTKRMKLDDQNMDSGEGQIRSNAIQIGKLHENDEDEDE